MGTNVEIDDEFYKEVAKIKEDDSLEYPSINNFVNKAVKEKLERYKNTKQ